MMKQTNYPELLIFSQHRWEDLPQRSRELILRESLKRRIYLYENPNFSSTQLPFLQLNEVEHNVQIVTPHLPEVIHPQNVCSFMRDLVDNLIFEEELLNYVLWYFDALAVNFTDHLEPVSMQFVSLEDTPKQKISQYLHLDSQFNSLDFSMSSVI